MAWYTWRIGIILTIMSCSAFSLSPSCASATCQAYGVEPSAEDATVYLKRISDELNSNMPNMSNPEPQGFCTASDEAIQMGKGWGGHYLLNRKPRKQPCVFYSFGGLIAQTSLHAWILALGKINDITAGISNDYSFDVDVSERWGCHGVALDPTVTHASELHKNVLFFKIGARTLDANADKQWPLVTSVPALRQFFRHTYIDVLKMDCEGCEYSLARDVLAEDPLFFHRVGQFEFEAHVNTDFMTTERHAIWYGELFHLLEQAGMKLIKFCVAACSGNQECPQLLLDAGYPCSKDHVHKCHMFTFARKDKH